MRDSWMQQSTVFQSTYQFLVQFYPHTSAILWGCAKEESGVERQAWQWTSCRSCKIPLKQTKDISLRNRQWRQVLVALPCSCGVGVLCHEVRWIAWVQGVRNQWIHHSLRGDHGFHQFFYDGGCVIWAILDVPPWHEKLDNVTPHSKGTPVAWHCLNLNWFNTWGMH